MVRLVISGHRVCVLCSACAHMYEYVRRIAAGHPEGAHGAADGEERRARRGHDRHGAARGA